MPEVLDIEQIEVEKTQSVKPKWNSWVAEIRLQNEIVDLNA